MRYFLGVDVGGTFTDVVVGDTDGHVATVKVPTTPDDPREGVAAGVAEILRAQGVGPRRVSRVVHGTTLAANVILERKGSDVAFVTTEGFGDMLRLGRESRQEEDRFDLFFRPPVAPVAHGLTFEVRERVDSRGKVLVEPDVSHLRRVAAQVAESGARSVAIECRAALPAEAYVVTSSEVWPEVREYERAMTTVMCAYVGPVMNRYLAGLQDQLAAIGLRCPIEVMESSGGVMSASLASRRPVYTIESGGAAGVMAAAFVGRLIDANEVVSFDMGGTTAKTGIVRQGRPDVTHDCHVGGVSTAGNRRAGSGYPVKIPVVDLAEVGAGGGSIASVDSGGALRVGPESSGSVPGPACYGRGGAAATVTDANLLLGYLRPGKLEAGVSLSEELAAQAVRQHVAAPLSLPVPAAARAIHDVANATMASAIRVVTVQRGIDPRRFTLVAFGGAGPMHAVELAEMFGIDEVAVPRGAGVAAALGLITSDLVVERARTWIMPLASARPSEVAAVYEELERHAEAELPSGREDLTVARSVDVRYRGQAHELTVPAPSGPMSAASLEELGRSFGARYRDAYGVDLAAPTELVTFRVRLVRQVEKLSPVAHALARRDADPALAGHRPVWLGGSHGFVECPVYGWEKLAPGSLVTGPAVVEGPDTTVVAPPQSSVHVDRWWNLRLRRSTGPPAARDGRL
ncbi:MAG: hydantoinase/oxoprolinase family protein [Actinobacteria bacterium]|nr:MAG: hydantoinase/oxoprolinase family protein [Actinomycetota bacterium]